MKENILDRGLLEIISDFGFDQIAPLLAFARAHKIDWADSEATGCFLYDFALAMIIAVPKRNSDWCKRGHHNDPLPGAVHTKVVPRYVEDFRDSGMKRGFAVAF